MYTLWSAVYNPKTLAVDIVIGRNYLDVYRFNLNDFQTE